MNQYTHGTPVELTCRFADKTNAPKDPTTVKLLLLWNGTETELVYGTDADVIKSSVGYYSYEFVPGQGDWEYRWLGQGATGTVRGGGGGSFRVNANRFSQ